MSSPPSPSSSPPPSITAGRICLSLVAIITSVGCYVADWNETHVKNPRWPPHARFHNGQTMSMGLCLGVLTAYFAWRPVVLASYHGPAAERGGLVRPRPRQQQQQDGKGHTGGGPGGMSTNDGDGGASASARAQKEGEREKENGIGEKECITIAAVLGSLYYVTGLSGILYPGTKWLDPEFGDGAPQMPIFVGSAVLAWCGWWLEMRRLAGKGKLA